MIFTTSFEVEEFCRDRNKW